MQCSVIVPTKSIASAPMWRPTRQHSSDVGVPGGTVTDAGLRTNVDVAIRYLASWLAGTGAAAIFNLMEDAATAEISRSQVWQWVRAGVPTEDGDPITADRVRQAITDGGRIAPP